MRAELFPHLSQSPENKLESGNSKVRSGECILKHFIGCRVQSSDLLSCSINSETAVIYLLMEARGCNA